MRLFLLIPVLALAAFLPACTTVEEHPAPAVHSSTTTTESSTLRSAPMSSSTTETHVVR